MTLPASPTAEAPTPAASMPAASLPAAADRLESGPSTLHLRPSHRLRRHAGEARRGLRPLLTLALPLIVSTGCFALTLFIDRTLLLWFDPNHAGAAMAAGNMYWTAACLPVMAVGYLSTIVAQADGGRRLSTIGPAIWQSVWLTAAMLPLCMAGMFLAGPLFGSMGHEPALASVEASFFRLLMLVAPGAMLEAGLSAFYVGRGQTRPVMQANIVATVVNLLLDAVLIFGLLGLPALGAVGAAIATAAAMWIKVVWYAVGIWRAGRLGSSDEAADPAAADEFGLRAWQPNKTLLLAIVSGGGTLGVQQMLRSGAISGVLAAVGQIGASALAASSLVMSLVQLATIPLIGLATAVTVLSGQRLAQRGTPRASWSIVSGGLFLSLAVLVPLSAIAIGTPDVIVNAFAVGPGADEIASLGPQVQPLLLLGAVLLVLDTVAQLVAAALRGLGAVRPLFLSTAIASGVVLTLVPLCIGQLEALWSLLLVWTAIQAVGCGVSLWRQPVQSASLPLFDADRVNQAA